MTDSAELDYFCMFVPYNRACSQGNRHCVSGKFDYWSLLLFPFFRMARSCILRQKLAAEIEEQMLETEGGILRSYTGEDCGTRIRVVRKGVGFHLRQKGVRIEVWL